METPASATNIEIDPWSEELHINSHKTPSAIQLENLNAVSHDTNKTGHDSHKTAEEPNVSKGTGYCDIWRKYRFKIWRANLITGTILFLFAIIALIAGTITITTTTIHLQSNKTSPSHQKKAWCEHHAKNLHTTGFILTSFGGFFVAAAFCVFPRLECLDYLDAPHKIFLKFWRVHERAWNEQSVCQTLGLLLLGLALVLGALLCFAMYGITCGLSVDAWVSG